MGPFHLAIDSSRSSSVIVKFLSDEFVEALGNAPLVR